MAPAAPLAGCSFGAHRGISLSRVRRVVQTHPSQRGLCAVGQLEQALLRLCSGFTPHGYLLVAGLVFNPVTFAAGAGCAPLCLLTCRYLTETMELLGVLAW